MTKLVAERTIGPLSRLDFARFSIASDDPNRVHIEESVAAAAGLPSVIGSGGILTGLLTDLVFTWAGRERVRTASIKMFLPLTAGIVLTAAASILSEGDDAMTVRAEVTDEQRRVVGVGEFRVAKGGATDAS